MFVPSLFVALGLNLYDVLEQDVYTDLSEYVPLINKTALSIVYDNVSLIIIYKYNGESAISIIVA